MSATLGGLLKDYRLQKNITQAEVAFALGWKESSRLSRIEQGKVKKPPRNLLKKIFNIMKLSDEEKNSLFLVGGYPPTRKEILHIRRRIDSFIQKQPHPVMVSDFSARVVSFNKLYTEVFQLSKERQRWIKENRPWIFEIEYDPKLAQNEKLKGKYKKEWREALLQWLIQFIHVEKGRTKEKWYVEMVKKMMNNSLFRETWDKAQLAKPGAELTYFYNLFPVVHPEDSKKVLYFKSFNISSIIDPRIDIEFQVPANIETYKYFYS